MRATSFDLLEFRRATRRPPHQVRQLIHITSIVRWIGLVVAGVIGVVAPPRSAIAFVLLILAVGIYNSWSIVAGRRADDASVPIDGSFAVLVIGVALIVPAAALWRSSR